MPGGILTAMFEVLAFVYQNYWDGDACPELPALQRKLGAVGFDSHEVVDALVWLEDLKQAARGLHRPQAVQPSTVTASPHQLADARNPWQNRQPAMRLFTDAEQARLGATGWRFVAFLASIGALPQDRLELVMERTMAASGDPISMEDLKLIVLMVFWSLGEEPDALVFDELCDNRIDRLAN